MANDQLQKSTPQELATRNEIINKLVLDGDLSRMDANQKTGYYKSFCDALGLNPLTQPFQIIAFQGKQRLYATKDCTEQLRKIHGVSITDISTNQLNGVFIVTAKAVDKNGKTDAATGAVTIEGLKGDALANALMKAETKAKRRVTLSICGLGILDESEMETMRGAISQNLDDSIPTEEERQLLVSLTYSSSLDEDGRERAFKSIQDCVDYGMYDRIKNKLESLQPGLDNIVNPSQKQINNHLKKSIQP